MKPLKCEWCESKNIHEEKDVVYWELPDGTRAIEIHETPVISCQDCNMKYLTEEKTKEIEDQLFLIDASKLPKKTTYENIMKQPRLLKRNYFDFSSSS
jgi:uncharacterized YokU family protein